MKRRRTRYETAFALTAIVLASAATFAFSEIGRVARPRAPERARRASAVGVAAETRVLAGASAIAPADADYERFAEEDARWRRAHALPPDLFMMKRRAMQERVYERTRQGRRGAAIGELARWTDRYPRDREALLWLARLLREQGRTREALATYRQLLALGERAR